ncbi:hypothetical protein B0A55_06722 [Friedmanniomyces simplex]|uniref:SnoaL-like domain-containing protein n=1 Tax=Friedmanniomyces simplex TaxID=329884 RepID=A0A4U0X2F2_9PEZI|nr:hypothetical protein B0A55_06722 [Friedmanniomyces simplex]
MAAVNRHHAAKGTPRSRVCQPHTNAIPLSISNAAAAQSRYHGTLKASMYFFVTSTLASLPTLETMKSTAMRIRAVSETDGIKKTLNAYRNNLVASNVAGCVDLYAPDGVTMAPGFETQVGHDAVKKWYTMCFETITLDVAFDIKEAVAVSEEYGFARTTSAGAQKINKTGETSREANQELFVMKKVEGEWKIARYCFSSTNPPK